MRRYTLVLTLALIGSLTLAPGTGLAATLSHTAGVRFYLEGSFDGPQTSQDPLTRADYIGSFPEFDPALGTLVDVAVEAVVDYGLGIDFFNYDYTNATSGTYRIQATPSFYVDTASGYTVIASGDTFELECQMSQTNPGSCSASDGVTTTVTGSLTGVTSPPRLYFYAGASIEVVEYFDLNYDVFTTLSGTAALTLTYTYVPEPGSAAMALSGLGLWFAARVRSRARR